ncbi:unnamed protein product [Callosobruchus maculatus]|uniref:Uncharacterized protein n=1 Tax=Callosobruchus maculatus TaxID=64391 RepID=A0A653CC63_CALMS|nr:unnamed protein product [Callosobruchus maculatus]
MVEVEAVNRMPKKEWSKLVNKCEAIKKGIDTSWKHCFLINASLPEFKTRFRLTIRAFVDVVIEQVTTDVSLMASKRKLSKCNVEIKKH